MFGIGVIELIVLAVLGGVGAVVYIVAQSKKD
jgi:hypothetical protein